MKMKQKAQKAPKNEDTIPNCDTFSTQSTGNSAESISPVNGDSDEQIALWLSKGNIRKDPDEDNSFGLRNLNDAIILSNIEGIIEISNNDDDNEDVLFAPSTVEERQNERYARKVGIHLYVHMKQRVQSCCFLLLIISLSFPLHVSSSKSVFFV